MILSISGNFLRRLPPQFMKVMKLTFFLLTAAFLQVHAKTFSQVTLSLKDAPLEKVFREIERQTGYGFLYTKKMLDDAPKVTIDVKDATVNQVLVECFKGQSLEYSIDNNTIVITRKLTLVTPQSDVILSLSKDISGRITDLEGHPLEGANVKVKGSNNGTTTNVDGIFILKNVDENATIEISYVGFETQLIPVKNKTSISLSLKRNDNPLDQVQVIAYGTTTRRLATGNISTVKAEEIEKQPVSNPLLALEGRVPGLFITQNTGVPGGGISIRLQGQNSLQRGNDPLYVIDGVPYVSQLMPNISGSGGILGNNGNTNLPYGQGGDGNPLSFVNPADIESIDILKDADATAIYGSRAANGAILITTKKGKGGRTTTDINAQTGWGKVAHFLPLLNTAQYLQMRNEAFKNDGTSPGPTAYDINGTWDTTRYTDWQKKLIGGTAQYTDAHASVSGGSSNTNFLVGAGYHKETTVFPGDLSDQKGSLHFNLNNVSSNQKFRLTMSGSYLLDNNQLINNDLTNTAIRIAPDAPALYNADGTLNWAPLPDGTSTWLNPLSYLYNKYKSKTNNLISSALLSYQIFPGLELRSSFGYTNMQINEITIFPLTAYAPETRVYNSRIAVYQNNNINSLNIEPQVDYKKTMGKGKFEALAGTTFFQNNSSSEQLYGLGYNSDAVLEDINAASSIGVNSKTITSNYKYNAIFGRINYNWQDKYILNLAARRDGSSRFGSDNLFHNFGSAGGAWLFSNEDFIKKSIPLLSFGKLRANYGTTGNDQIGDYQFMNLYSPYSVAVAYQGIAAIIPSGLPNPHLQWEETKKLEFGLDLGIAKDRILLNINYYRNRSSNELQGYALPIITGFTNIQTNLPALVQNKGWEFSLNTTNVKWRHFSWNSSINLTMPENKLLSYPGLATSSAAYTYVIGYPVTIQKRLPFLGVDPATGLYQVRDSHGNTVSTSPLSLADRTALINVDPEFYGGFQNRFKYRGFELDFLFQFVKQTKANYSLGTYPGMFINDNSYYPAQSNEPVWVLENRWQKPGDISSIQRFSASYPSVVRKSYNNASVSSVVFSDASFIRLKNLSFSWQLPQSWNHTAHLQNARIYVNGENLITITHYKGMDPENANVRNLPPLRVITMGVQISL